MFIDYAEIEVKAGHGGPGCISFRHEKYINKGGPDGGDGGRGGDIIFRADRNLATLMDFRYKKKYSAPNGRPGEGSQRSGKSGQNMIILVPAGTLIKDMASGRILADLDDNGKEVILAKGGRGGRGNVRFKSATNQAPRRADEGIPGEEYRLALELKLLADVGLVGLPNAGKSTMLARLSDARPKIADYPFTTLVPNLGMVRLREFKSFAMADIPGIIEGASQGKGLGIQFLKHIQRTRLILYLIDTSEGKIAGTLKILKRELKNFDPALAKRPSLIVLNKIDLILEKKPKIPRSLKKDDYILFSGVTGFGAKDLLNRIEQELDRQREMESADQPDNA